MSADRTLAQTWRDTMAKVEASEIIALPARGDKLASVYGLLAANLSQGALKVGMALVWHFNTKTGRCDPSHKRLAEETGQTDRSVRRAIGELIGCGLVTQSRHGGGAFTNAYAIQWARLRKLYSAWLSEHGLAANTPDADVLPPRTPVSATPDTSVHQIEEEIEKGIGEGRSPSASSLKRAGASRLNGFQGEAEARAVGTLYRLGKPKGPASATVAREKAHERFDTDLRNHLSTDAYVDFVGRVDEATVEQAIEAEVAKPGVRAGLEIALEVMTTSED